MRTAVLTISTTVARREAEDVAGPLLAHLAEEAGVDVEAMEVIPDDFPLIEDRLHHYVDDNFTFIFTTGGTGMTPDDVTPEATRAVVEREAPGIAEAMRAESLRQTPMGMLARGMAVAGGGRHARGGWLLEGRRGPLAPAGAELVDPLIGAASGRTRVVTSHDPAGGLADADLALGLRAGSWLVTTR